MVLRRTSRSHQAFIIFLKTLQHVKLILLPRAIKNLSQESIFLILSNAYKQAFKPSPRVSKSYFTIRMRFRHMFNPTNFSQLNSIFSKEHCLIFSNVYTNYRLSLPRKHASTCLTVRIRYKNLFIKTHSTNQTDLFSPMCDRNLFKTGHCLVHSNAYTN